MPLVIQPLFEPSIVLILAQCSQIISRTPDAARRVQAVAVGLYERATQDATVEPVVAKKSPPAVSERVEASIKAVVTDGEAKVEAAAETVETAADTAVETAVDAADVAAAEVPTEQAPTETE